MQKPHKSSRLRCQRCVRPLSHCLCAHIECVDHRSRVLILQHPEEARHPLNTARLAALGLRHAELLVGESFPGLEARIAGAGRACLLFPAKGLPVVESESGASTDENNWLLIVPDGTWRKARQIIRSNPVLDTLPRLELPLGAPSQYRVRKASEAAAVSTVEAITRALTLLEPDRDFQPLLRPFNAMVEQQIQAMGEDTFRRNHLK